MCFHVCVQSPLGPVCPTPTPHRIPDIPVGRNYSILGMLTSLLLAYGGQMIGNNRGEAEPEP